jgi:hypothetical protein
MDPFKLWFGKFERKTVTQLMFTRGGYGYLKDFVLAKMRDVPSLKTRIRRVFKSADHLPVTAKCEKCDKVATHLIVQGNRSHGYTFLPQARCSDHLDVWPGAQVFPIKFSSLDRFHSRGDQWRCTQHIRRMCGLDGKRLSAQGYLDFFFPPETAPSNPDKPAATAKDEPPTTKDGQLFLL